MPPKLKFEYKGKPHEVRATAFGDKFVIRVFCGGDAICGVGYSISATKGDVAPAAMMRQAQREVQSGCAAERARIDKAVERQMEKLRPLARGYKARSARK
jgi:hypothetical protein